MANGTKIRQKLNNNKRSSSRKIFIENQTSQEEINDLESQVKLPFVIKDKILMHPGTWNSYYYSEGSIKEAYRLTTWNEENRALFYDHVDNTSEHWVGEVKNIRQRDDGVLLGDLYILDKDLAVKLAYGAKFGISPKVAGDHTDKNMNYFTYENFSVVLKPAVKTNYINSQQEESESESKSGFKKQNNTGEIKMSEEKAKADKAEEAPEQPEEESSKAESKMSEARQDLAFVEKYLNENPNATLSEAAKAYEKNKPVSKTELSEALDEFKSSILNEVKNVMREVGGNVPNKPDVQKGKTSQQDMRGKSKDMLSEDEEGEEVEQKMTENPNRKSKSVDSDSESKTINEMADELSYEESDALFLKEVLQPLHNYYVGGNEQ